MPPRQRPAHLDMPIEQLSHLLQSPAGREELAAAELARYTRSLVPVVTPRPGVPLLVTPGPVNTTAAVGSPARQAQDLRGEIERLAAQFGGAQDDYFLESFDTEVSDDFPPPSPVRREAARFRVDRESPPRMPFRPWEIEPGPQGGSMQEVGRVGRFPVLAENRPPRPAREPIQREATTPSAKPEPPIRRRNQWQHLLDDD